ncbi:hypothetical protein L226DRAFT_566759 [Lentinus tigrinus ALCF2SS1-7]|uniref:Uncharacterized protein n=1 Tax=Lentinus tigrinus ALCF2SS1-6 TaxID=1328759 RepID=A0A5C2SSB9_9APHY|nr:hypothetical protein L227DRAFT_649056 [Lentinus tigrinus ALCF2SS1-6]RPD80245.1 hypothetical protein L226DRAFT_566759 [Lentinus tigrinus ALCF2SS1-7]
MENRKHTQSRGFHVVRTSIFSLTVFISLAWLSFLCVEKFELEDSSDPNQKGLVWVLIAANLVTVLLMPILLLCEFREYLDAARMALLLVLHIGPSAFFVAWRPDFACPVSPTKHKLCQDVNLAIMIGNWVVPALVVFYSGFLAAMCYTAHYEPTTEVEAPKSHEKHLSELPMQVPATTDRRTSGGVMSLASAKRMLTRSQQTTPPLPNQPQPSYPFLPRPSPIDPPARAHVPPFDQTHIGDSAEPFDPYLPYLRPPPPKRPPQLTISIPPRPSQGRRTSIPMRPPSQLPSPATPKSSSRSTSRVMSMQQPALPPINESDDSSPRSSGRLSKPSPYMYAS